MTLIPVEWRFHKNGEEPSWLFGQITPAEVTILSTQTHMEFDGQTFSVGEVTTSWKQHGIERVTVCLY